MSQQLPKLPIAPLELTKKNYLQHASALIDENQLEHTKIITEEFFAETAPLLQKDLIQSAQHNAHTSWLSDAWLEGYLSVREAPPLSTSGGFLTQFHAPTNNHVKKIAYFLHGFATLSSCYMQGDLPPSQSGRGEPLDMSQWKFLQGMTRVPKANCDTYEYAETTPTTRYAVIFWNNQPFLLPILTATHEPYSVQVITNALQYLIDNNTIASDCPITAISLAGAETAAELIQELSYDEHNHASFSQLNNSLVHVHLVDEFPETHDASLKEYTFLTKSQLWAYKPMTLCADLLHDHYYLHIEHSPYDGGTIQGLIQRIEAIALNEDASTTITESIKQPLQKLTWNLSDEHLVKLAAIRDEHQNKTKKYDVKTVDVTVTDNSSLKLSQDALMQLIMQYAQLTTFGTVKNTYESADVSHFQSGRTECLRPVSEESVAFVTALRDGNANMELLHAAINTHKDRIKVCKKGHGFNRHLLGLQLMAQKRNLSPDFFKESTYHVMTTDMLSTSSLGNRWHIGDFAFTPTARGGLGISYFTTDAGYWFCISYTQELSESTIQFSEKLQEGCDRLYKLYSVYA